MVKLFGFLSESFDELLLPGRHRGCVSVDLGDDDPQALVLGKNARSNVTDRGSPNFFRIARCWFHGTLPAV
jgi:hypothetical protein